MTDFMEATILVLERGFSLSYQSLVDTIYARIANTYISMVFLVDLQENPAYQNSSREIDAKTIKEYSDAKFPLGDQNSARSAVGQIHAPRQEICRLSALSSRTLDAERQWSDTKLRQVSIVFHLLLSSLHFTQISLSLSLSLYNIYIPVEQTSFYDQQSFPFLFQSGSCSLPLPIRVLFTC